MFCSNCGNEIAEFDRFCTKCGSEIAQSKPAAPVTSTETQDASVQLNTTEQLVAGESAAPESPAAPATPVVESPATPAPTSTSEAAPTTSAAPTTPAPTAPAPTPAPAAPTQEVTPFTAVPQTSGQELTSSSKKSRFSTGVIIGVAGSIIIVLLILLAAGFLTSSSLLSTGYDDTEIDWSYFDSDTEYDWDDLNVVDANGNVTGYACINLNGEDLAELLLENGYYWSSYDECYVRSSDLAAVGFIDATGELMSRDEILALQEGGANEPVMIINSVAGYSSTSSAFNGALGVNLSDATYGDEEFLMGLVENDFGEQYLVMTFAHGDGTYDLCFINDLGVEEGLFFILTGLSGYTSVSEVWSDITSGSLSFDEDYDDTVTTTGTIVTTAAS